MTTSPIEVREEIDVVSVDPLFIERQRNRYSSRAVAYVVWLNGLAAVALLIGLTHASLRADQVKGFADAMLVFGAGSVCGLASSLLILGGPSDWSGPISLAGADPYVGLQSLPPLLAQSVSSQL
jgi:hypothetical protein